MTTNPEYLIGDYASQTLSEGERRQLFEAALQDQTLFDRLVEEERWRQLFSIPEVQRELRTALVEPPVTAVSSASGIFAGLRQWVEGLGRPVLPLAMGSVAALLLVVALLPQYAERGLLPQGPVAGVDLPGVEEPRLEEPREVGDPVELFPKGRPTGATPAGETGPISESATSGGELKLVAKSHTRSVLQPKSTGSDTMNFSYALELNQESGPLRVPESYRFEPRDQFRLRLEVDFTAWLYLFNRATSEDEYTVLYPMTSAEHEPMAPRRELLIPARVWLTMDETPDDEHLVLVVASQPWPAVSSGQETVPAGELEAALGRAEDRLESVSWRRSVVDNRVRIMLERGEGGMVMVVRLFGT